MRDKLAIVGSHPGTREKAPYDNPDFDIWIFNEAAQKPWAKRVDACFQMHSPAVYKNPENINARDHWDWLQQEHDFPIYMQEEDPQIPSSQTYPLDAIFITYLSHLRDGSGRNISYFPSTVTYALALGLYYGYPEIHIYGIEAASDTEYRYQRSGLMFWIGLAIGTGARVIMHSGSELFDANLYGYTDSPYLRVSDYMDQIAQLEPAANENEDMISRVLSSLPVDVNSEDYYSRFISLSRITKDRSAPYGMIQEFRKYADKAENVNPVIPRQEFEISAAQAAEARDKQISELNFEAGRSWVAYKIMRQSDTDENRRAFSCYAEKQINHARAAGVLHGVYQANVHLMKLADKRFTAHGGERAVIALSGG